MRRERAGCGVGDGIEREPERKPRNHQRHAAAERRRSVVDAGGHQHGGEPGNKGELGEPEQPDSATLPMSKCRGRTVERISSTTRLLFSSTTPASTHWPVDRQRSEQKRGAEHGDDSLGVLGRLACGLERRGRELGRGRKTAAERPHRRVGGCGELRIDALPEDDPVVAEEEQRVDFLFASSSWRPAAAEPHDLQPHLRVEGLRGTLQRGVEPAEARAQPPRRDVVSSWSTIGNALEAPTMTSMITVDQRKAGLRSRSRISRQATSEMARRALMTRSAPRRAPRARAGRS